MAFVDFLMLAFVVIGVIFGFFKGMVKLGLAIVTFYLSIVVASLYYRPLASGIAKNSSTSFQVIEMLSFLLLLVFIYVILFLTALYTFRYLTVKGSIQFLDKIIGAFLGLILGAMFASIFAMMMRYLFIYTNAPATLDFPAMRFLQESTFNSVLKDVFLNTILPILYAPISPILPESADIIFRSIQ